jgi:hypothetical protein
MIMARRDFALGGVIGTQFVRNDPFGNEAPAFYQLDHKSLCCALVSPRLQDFVKNHAVLLDRTPQPV